MRQAPYFIIYDTVNLIQCKMARAALGWSRADLGAASGITGRTVARFEDGEPVAPQSVQAMRHALEANGVLFVDNGTLAGAVVPPRVG